MMRIFVLFLFFTLLLESKNLDSCYTIQLLSIYNSNENKINLESEKILSSCRRMKIGDELTVRCGCFNTMKEAKEHLPTLREKYKKAYIASTYKYRFENKDLTINAIKTKVLKKSVLKKKPPSLGDKELRMMVQTFIYSNDLEYAYKTAKLGYSQNPYSSYWNQKMAEISKWTGRGEEAIEHTYFLYKQKPNKKLEKELIDYGLSAYQYKKIKSIVLNKAKRDGTEEDINKMILAYDRIGIPEDSAEFLLNEYQKDNTKHASLTKALQIYLNMGDLESTKNIVKIIVKNNFYTLQDVKLLSYYYFIEKDIEAAYKILFVDFDGEKDLKYYKLASDFGWYLQRFENAASASESIIKKNQGRVADYERVIQVNKDKKNSKALQTSLAAYKKYKLPYLFFSYANYALRDKKYDALKLVIDEIDLTNSKIKNDTNYWILKSQLYQYSHNPLLAKQALKKALRINPTSLQTQLTAIALYRDFDMPDELRGLLQELAEKPYLDASLYPILASSYFYLQDINRASYYMNKMLKENSSLSNTIEYKFLQADIFSIKNNKNAFMRIMYEITNVLQQNAINNPQLWSEDKHLNNYLRASMYTLHKDEFSDLLARNKKYLNKNNYDDLSYTFAIIKTSFEEAHTVYQRTRRRKPWLQLTNAMQGQKHNEIQDLLHKYIRLLPFGDAAQASNNDGQIALSQSIGYKALALNDDSQNAYIQHLGLSKERSDEFGSKLGYLIRDPLERKYIQLDNSLYLRDGWHILSGVDYYLNSINDNLLLAMVPDDTLEVNIGLKKVFRRASIEFRAGYVDSMDTYLSTGIKGAYKINNYFSVSTELSRWIKAEESVELLLGAKKNMLSLGFLWNIMPSTSLDIIYEKNKYYSQDDIYIGDGNYVRALLGYQIRNGYPDMRIGLFYDTGSYNETSQTRGLIEKLQVVRNPVLPTNFYNVGLNFAYGIVNSELYTRVWRPYFDVSTFYNGDVSTFNYGLNFGYGGKIFHQDHLVFGVSYSESVYGNGGKIFELFLKYKFLYKYP